VRLLLRLHSGEPLAPHDLWTAWAFEPSLLIPLAAAVLVYAWGTRNVWRRAGRGHGISRRHIACLFGAVAALVLALVSPLDALSDSLFSAHMVQHLLLMLVAAPLLVLSDSAFALLWALPRRWARPLARRAKATRLLSRAWRVLSNPIAAWLLFAVVVWLWHAPALFQAALRDETLHALEHLAFLASALLFWWVLFRDTAPNHVRYGMAVPYLFLTLLQSGILGALMTFTSQAWYPYYAPLVGPWGLTPLQDQQLAGLIMWFPGGALFTLLTIGYFAAWLRALDERSARLPHPFPHEKEQGSNS
jgi:putative membrane protein